MEFRELTENEFDSFSKSYPNSNLWQSKYMASMRERRGFTNYYVGILKDDEIIAACFLSGRTVFLGKMYFQLLRGPLIDYKDKELFTYFHEQLVQFLKEHQCLYFHVDPYVEYVQRDLDGNQVEDGFNNEDVYKTFMELGYTHEGFTRGINMTREPRWIYTIDIKDKTSQEVLSNMERRASRSIKHALNYQIKVEELDREHLSTFENIVQETGERRGFENRSNDYYETIYDTYHPDGYVKFLKAVMNLEDYKKDLMKDLEKSQKVVDTSMKRLEQQESPKIRRKMNLAQEQIENIHKKIDNANEIIKENGVEITLASGVFFLYGNEILCLMSGADERFIHFQGLYAMHWYIIQWGIEHGYSRYNLYGISGIFDSSSEDYGVYMFKKGFNGEVVELLGDFEYVVDQPKYSLYTTLRNIKHKIKGN